MGFKVNATIFLIKLKVNDNTLKIVFIAPPNTRPTNFMIGVIAFMIVLTILPNALKNVPSNSFIGSITGISGARNTSLNIPNARAIGSKIGWTIGPILLPINPPKKSPIAAPIIGPKGPRNGNNAPPAAAPATPPIALPTPAPTAVPAASPS